MASQSKTISLNASGVFPHERPLQVQGALLPGGRKRLDVAFEGSLDGLCCFPCGILQDKCLCTIDGEQELKIGRLFNPKRTIVMKHCDKPFQRYVVLARCIGGRVYEFYDALF